ncbi:MAG: hypothetical protein RR702_06595 [Clostridia bacterium]
MKRKIIDGIIILVAACCVVLMFPCSIFVMANASEIAANTKIIAVLGIGIFVAFCIYLVMQVVSHPFRELNKKLSKNLAKAEKWEDMQTGRGIMQIVYARVKGITENVMFAYVLNLARQGVFKLEVIEETQATYIAYGNMQSMERQITEIETEIVQYNKNIIDSIGEKVSITKYITSFEENKANNAKFIARIIKLANEIEKPSITKRAAAEARSVFSSLQYLDENENASSLTLEQLEKAVVFAIGTRMEDEQIKQCITCIRAKIVKGEEVTPFAKFIVSRGFLDITHKIVKAYIFFGYSDTIESLKSSYGKYV